MSRLIDVDALIQEFREIEYEEGAIGLDFVAIIDVIKEQPTAFDVDKVVEQIENIMDDENIRFVDQAVRKAVKIVMGGGVNE